MSKTLLEKSLALIDSLEWGSDAHECAIFTASICSARLHEQLRQLMQVPVGDGDVISKQQRDELIALGLATRCCFEGEQGYTVATYRAYTILKGAGAQIGLEHK